MLAKIVCTSFNRNSRTVLEALLDNGANVNASDKEGNTPLLLASKEGHEALVRGLIEENANITHKVGRGNYCCLYQTSST